MNDKPALMDMMRDLAQPLRPHETGVEPVLAPLGDVKCVLFDIYGTLLISASGDIGVLQETTKDLTFERALEKANIEFAPGAGGRGGLLFVDEIRQEHARAKAQGVPFPEVEIREVWSRVIARLNEEHYLESDNVSSSQIEVCSCFYEASVNPVCLMPGMLNLLSRLKSEFLLGIVSNAQFYTPITMEALTGSSLGQLGFDAALCSWSYQLLKAKPDPAVFALVMQVLEQHGISPEETVYVGNDMLNDMATATDVGCKSILFAGDQRSLRLRKDHPRCAGLQPDAIVTHLDQLTHQMLWPPP